MVDAWSGRLLFISWREVTGNFAKAARTVQRREEHLGLPIHRPLNQPTEAFFASSDEIDKFATRQPRALLQTYRNLPRQRQATVSRRPSGFVNQPTGKFRIS
jgi:hypothetical protein